MNRYQKNVDLLYDRFWKQGYFTIGRKYGTYLPDPPTVGGFEIDILGKHKNNLAIGLVLYEEDLLRKDLLEKLEFLATRKSKYTNKPVLLFVGVEERIFIKVKQIATHLSPAAKKNIRLYSLIDTSLSLFNNNNATQSRPIIN